MHIGERIKHLRLSKNMTIKRLAEKTELSVGFISNVERDVNSPTISSLQKICKALGTNMADFFTNTKNSSHVLRKEDRQILQNDEKSPFKLEMFSLPRKNLQPIFIDIIPGGQYGDESMSHDYDEVCLVLEGQVHFWAQDDEYTLNPGDCIYLESMVPHWLRNKGRVMARTYWVALINES